MQSVLQFTAQQFGRAIVMPNLFEPITSTSRAEVYREEIMEALGILQIKSKFEPLMTLYLTDDTDIEDLREVTRKGLCLAVNYIRQIAPQIHLRV